MASVEQIEVDQTMDEQLQQASVHVVQPLLSQSPRNSPTKRASMPAMPATPPKKPRQSDIIEIIFHSERSSTSNEKEKVPPGVARPVAPAPPAPAASQQRTDVSSMLLEAAGANGEQATTSQIEVQSQLRDGIDSSETPLDSHDRNQRFLGVVPVKYADARQFIQYHWGVEGTMVKIIDCVRRGSETITVHELIKHGPVLPGLKRMMAAKCFVSILKLKENEFIRISKDPKTSEILNITLGPIFDQCL